MQKPVRLATPLLALLAAALVLAGVLGGRAAATELALPPALGLAPVTPQRAALATPAFVTYHGGPVMHSNRTYAIFWSPPDHPMPADYQAGIVKYFKDVAAASGSPSSAYAVATQYFDDEGPVTTSSTFGGAIVATDPVPGNECTDIPAIQVSIHVDVCVLQHTLAGVIQNAIDAHGLQPGLDTIFFLFTPPGIGDCVERGNACSYAQFGAYHSYLPGGILYAVHPSYGTPPYTVIAHEHVEAMTDPEGSAWFDSTDPGGFGEIGDLCSRVPALQTLNATVYLLQEEWSNANGGCAPQAPPPTVPLTIVTSGDGDGVVTAIADGLTLSCRSWQDASCRTVVRQGAALALTASASDGSSFASWDAATGCSAAISATCTVTTGAGALTATAAFDMPHPLFSIAVTLRGRGTIRFADGKTCRKSCVVTFPAGAVITVVATPAQGWRLKKLTDDSNACRAPRLRCTLQLEADEALAATFVKIPPPKKRGH